jgi:hypothetical protein
MYGGKMKMMRERAMDGQGRMGSEIETVEFQPPQELKLDGESGSAMVDWRMTPSGTVEIVAFDGVTLGEKGQVDMTEDAAEMEMDDMEEEA